MFSLQFHDTINIKKSKIKRGLIMCLRSSWRFVNARKMVEHKKEVSMDIC